MAALISCSLSSSPLTDPEIFNNSREYSDITTALLKSRTVKMLSNWEETLQDVETTHTLDIVFAMIATCLGMAEPRWGKPRWHDIRTYLYVLSDEFFLFRPGSNRAGFDMSTVLVSPSFTPWKRRAYQMFHSTNPPMHSRHHKAWHTFVLFHCIR